MVAQMQKEGTAGFKPHVLTTAIVNLFEGITVSRLDPKVVEALNMEEILRDHDGNLVVAYRPAMKGFGALIVDCAFTKLYCNWDDAGSARFVKNCACVLAVDLQSPNAQPEAVEADSSDDTAGAVRSSCATVPWFVLCAH